MLNKAVGLVKTYLANSKHNVRGRLITSSSAASEISHHLCVRSQLDAIQNSVLEKLKKPWSASSLTVKQTQQQRDIINAKKLWDEVLEEFRKKKKEKSIREKSKIAAATKGKEKDSSAQPFRFLDLPTEIRNAIYDMSMEDDDMARESRHRQLDPAQTDVTYSERGHGSRWWTMVRSYSNKDKGKCKIEPTPEQKKHEQDLRKLLSQISRNHLSKCLYSAGCHEAFDKYKAEHAMYSRRCAHEHHDQEGEGKKDKKGKEEEERYEKRKTEHMIPINERGNLCGDVPMLSLVNRQLFQDTFYLFSSEPKDGMWFRWKIRNLCFFPFLRFMQNVIQPPFAIEIQPRQVHVLYDDKDKGRDSFLHMRKFQNVKRLIELHWLQGFPLWACLTSMCDTGCCNGPLGEILYSVRQIVALYRIAHSTWQYWSIEFLRACEIAESERGECDDARTYRNLLDADLVEKVIDALCKAIEYNLGCKGKFSTIGPNETKWDEDLLKKFHHNRAQKKVAYSVEHAIVNCMHQYRRVVDEEFRDTLSKEEYTVWEALPETGTTGQIPEGIVL